MSTKKRKRFFRYLDTETTGLGTDAEIVELALLSSSGATLLDTLVRPTRATRWPDAQRIHGITPEMVKDAPTLADLVPQLVELLTGHHLVVYNLGYDMRYFPDEVCAAPAKMSCCMERFAEHYGDWNAYHESYRWQKLDRAAAYVEHTWDGAAHRARADASACRSVWRFLRKVARDEQTSLRLAAEGAP